MKTKVITVLCFVSLMGFFASSIEAQQPTQEELIKMVRQQAEQMKQMQEQMDGMKAAMEKAGVTEDLQEMVRTEVESQIEETESGFSDELGDIWENLRRVQIHGYVSQGFLYSTDNNYMMTDSTNGEFEFNEMAINFSANISDELNVGMQLFARDQGKIGNNAINLDWAYADYRFEDYLGLRAGIMKIPHGLYNETRDLDMARTSVFLPQGVYEDQFREVRVSMMGAGLYGEVPMDAAGSLSYNAMAGSQAFDDISGGYTALWSNYGDADNYKSEAGFTSAGQLIWNTPLDGLRVGGSYYYANELSWYGKSVNGYFANYFEIDPGSDWGITFTNWVDLIASAEYTWNNLTLAGEYRKKTADSDTTGFGKMDRELEGWYASASYRFTDWFELGSYFSRHTSDGNTEDDIAISSRFDITDNWIAKLEVHHLNGAVNSLDGSFFDTKDNDWWMMAAKVTFSF